MEKCYMGFRATGHGYESSKVIELMIIYIYDRKMLTENEYKSLCRISLVLDKFMKKKRLVQ